MHMYLSVVGEEVESGNVMGVWSQGWGENEAVELVATVLSNLVEGDVLQMQGEISQGGTGTPVVPVLGEQKSYLKTASLMAKFAHASIVLGGALPAYAYRRNLGIAFQLIDDTLDFSPLSTLGKPGYGTDLKLGLATAPTLYAWEEHPEMAQLVARRFKHEGDVEQACTLVMHSNALERTRNLAKEYSNKALEVLDRLPHTDAKDALASLASTVVERAG
ncbi:hypothetical protein BS47DRAFT_1365974 [Hydnum rufescens UP504]|uniref:Geranylgeranyl pyrophosphate synthase n=1 Tax=Hydnum rufescens UP504 TaxID=1448309 RepID=A0A9P6AMB8_9AGAM|nr:hypothetical protein BS47DRAFT_1365974 [Hydnum rufescens UP504]